MNLHRTRSLPGISNNNKLNSALYSAVNVAPQHRHVQKLDPSDCNSQKVDGAHARLENAFNKMMDKIDKDVIRQNYEDMFLCSANCYKDRTSPIEDLHSCTERCNIKLEENKDFFQRELDSVERSIDRCERDCTELMQNLSNADSNTQSLQNCLSKCVDTHIDQFPSLIKRLKKGQI